MAPGKQSRTTIAKKDDDSASCLVPGCSAVTHRSKPVALFSMSFGDLPFWWKSTAWVVKYKSELASDARICEVHFEERFIDRTRKKPRLLPGTVPTLFLGVLELRHSNDDQASFNPMVFYCRLCAKKEERPIQTHLNQIPSMAEIVACCLGNYQQVELPTGVCDDCIRVMRTFEVFVKKCERSQVQLLKISGQLGGADKENSTKNPPQFESVDLCMDVTCPPSGEFDSQQTDCVIKQRCSHCGKSFINIDNYHEHLKIHDDDDTAATAKESGYVCQICNRSFDDKELLRDHLESVHENKTRNECSQCDKTFGVQSALNAHMRVHSYKHRCNECERTFPTRDKLKVHEMVHTGEKYKCDICDAEFRFKPRLKLHKMRVHNMIPIDEDGAKEKKGTGKAKDRAASISVDQKPDRVIKS